MHRDYIMWKWWNELDSREKEKIFKPHWIKSKIPKTAKKLGWK